LVRRLSVPGELNGVVVVVAAVAVAVHGVGPPLGLCRRVPVFIFFRFVVVVVVVIIIIKSRQLPRRQG
jgi:hypothetical protein